MSPPSGDADQRSILKALFLSKGKDKLPNFSKGEDRAGFKGFAGFPHRGSSVAVFPSYPVTREKGLNSVGSCGMMGVENLEVSSYQHSRSSLSLLPPPSSLVLPHLSPSVPVLPNSAIQSQFPTKPRVKHDFFSKKDDDGDGAFCLGSVGNPNRDVVVSQLVSLNHLSESFKSFKPNPNSPLGPPNLVTVSQGDAESPPMGRFQIEGLSPSKMAKVCEVLSSLDLKVYSRRKNRFYTNS